LAAALAPWRATRWCKAIAQRLGLEIPREFDAAVPEPVHPGGELAQRELLTGLLEHRRVRVKYRARREREARHFTIEPLRLRTAAGLSYVDASVPPAAGQRTFALHRVISARATQHHFEPRRLPERTAFGAVEGEAVDVVVRFDAPVAEFIAERRWHPSQRIEPADDGSLLWRGRVSGEREFLGWVLGWAPWAEVLEPAAWRRTIGERAALLHARHLPRIPEHPPPRVGT
jgi:predicted DNA-binding transcriptional regulator YafY